VTERPYIGRELDLFEKGTTWKRYYARRLRPWIRGRVLEVGAGIGATTPFLQHESVVSWLCLEPDPGNLIRLLERLEHLPPSVPTESRAGTLHDLPLSPAFDTILYVDVLEHIADDRGELSAARDRLRADGSIVVLAPAHRFLFSPFDAAIGHFRRYDRRMLAAVTPEGLDLVRCFYLDAAGLVASLGNRLFLQADQPTSTQIRIWDRYLVRLSRILDPCLFHVVGKSVVGIWRRSRVAAAG